MKKRIFRNKNRRAFKNKKAIEMGFNWLFAIIVGAFILFLAIYASSKFITPSGL